MKHLIYVVTLVLLAPLASADSFEFYDFSNFSNIQLNGTAAYLNPNSSNVLSLTNDLGQSSSAFFTEAISLDNLSSFSAAFEFRITDPQGIYDNDGQGADGLTFVVHSNSNTVGANGGGLGYLGLDNSLAVEIDTWRNRKYDGNNGNHVGIDVNGSLNSIAMAPIDTRMNNEAVWTVWVDYDGLQELVEVRVSEDSVRPADPNLSTSVDVGEILGTTDAYIGFTSGTGAAAGNHDILSMIFYDDYAPVNVISVPEPSSLLIFATSVLILMFRSLLKSQKTISH